MKIITIIGSRETPECVLDFMKDVAEWCASNSIIVRSGKAEGADAAAIYGCMEAYNRYTLNAEPEMYVPWPNFGNHSMTQRWDSVQGSNAKAYRIAESIHPAWQRCSQGAQKLHTRNVCQILGKTLDKPSDLVLHWCKERAGKPTGGTATAVNLAVKYKCTTLNLLNTTDTDIASKNIVNILKGENYE